MWPPLGGTAVISINIITLKVGPPTVHRGCGKARETTRGNDIDPWAPNYKMMCSHPRIKGVETASVIREWKEKIVLSGVGLIGISTNSALGRIFFFFFFEINTRIRHTPWDEEWMSLVAEIAGPVDTEFEQGWV